MKRLVSCAALAGALALSPLNLSLQPTSQLTTQAHASGQAGVRVGNLTCHEAGGWGLVLGSSHPVSCVFTGDGDRTEHYKGTISKLGVDLGY